MSISQEIQRIKTNIANAYTQANEKGATLPQQQNSDNLADTIQSITTGGGTPVSVEEKDVNFYDYDGTRLYSYTLAEVQNLTELPALPSHTGLTCQGWNWTLADIKAEGKATDVGAMYITDDGKTRLYIDIEAEGRMTVPLCFQQSAANGVELDWGDGSAIETFSDINTNIFPTHTYSLLGKYMITLKVNSGYINFLGSNGSYNIMAATVSSSLIYSNMLYKVELGSNINVIGSCAFQYCLNLKSITIPNVFGYPDNIFGLSTFANCASLSTIIIPAISNKNGNSSLFNSCTSLNKIILNNEGTTLFQNIFKGCRVLLNITIPKKITGLSTDIFSGCLALRKITLPNISQITKNMFNGCSSLSNLIISGGVTSIGASAFAGCSGMAFYDFSTHTSIPTLVNTDAFNSIPTDCKIVVPDNLYETWIGTTNWSTYASKIIKKSDWDAL